MAMPVRAVGRALAAVAPHVRTAGVNSDCSFCVPMRTLKESAEGQFWARSCRERFGDDALLLDDGDQPPSTSFSPTASRPRPRCRVLQARQLGAQRARRQPGFPPDEFDKVGCLAKAETISDIRNRQDRVGEQTLGLENNPIDQNGLGIPVGDQPRSPRQTFFRAPKMLGVARNIMPIGELTFDGCAIAPEPLDQDRLHRLVGH